MMELQRQILRVLLGTLLDKGLIGRSAYDAALRRIDACAALPAFFQAYPRETDEHGAS